MTAPDPVPPPDTLAAALDYAARGWRVLPIKPGEKRPPMAAWQNAATTDPDTIRSWYTGLYRDHGVGIATGRESSIFVLDVDVADGKTGADTYQALVDTHGDLPATVTAVTGSGGWHYLWRMPTDFTVRNNAATRLGPGLDIRGEGGQIVAAPTVHPNGTAYRWVTGAGPDDLPVADAPAWLLELLRDPEPTPRPAPNPPAPTPGPFGPELTPADWYNANTTWDQLLTADGWTHAQTLGNGEQRWTRPGKTRRDGISATVGHAGRDIIKVFTSSVPELEADAALSRFAYTAAMHHRGDQAALARHVRTTLMGPPPQAHDDLTWLGTDPTTGPDGAPTEQPEPDHGWTPSDLELVLGDDYKPIRPTILTREDGAGLFYEARINALWGESGSCKSMLAQHTARQHADHGHATLYIDHEDTAAGTAQRFTELGLDPDQVVANILHVNPQRAWNPAAAAYITALVAERGITLAVIDSTGEAMADDGINPNADEEVARWHHELPRFLTRLGVTVVLIDHIPKDTGTGRPNLFAIGSQRKRAAINGAAYMVEAKVSPARGKDGHLAVICAKDRHGTYSRGQLVADAEVLSRDGGRRVTITLRHHEPVKRPTVLMGRVSQFLEQAGGWHSTRAIEKAVTGNGATIRTSIGVLVDEDYLEMEMRTGRSGGSFFRSLRPFDEATAILEPVDNPLTASTASQPRPNRVQPTGDEVKVTASTASTAPNTRGGGEDAVNRPAQDAVPPVENPDPYSQL